MRHTYKCMKTYDVFDVDNVIEYAQKHWADMVFKLSFDVLIPLASGEKIVNNP